VSNTRRATGLAIIPRHIIRCHSTQDTRVHNALDDVASNICQALIRGVTTHAADYQVPVGEYGRHWNFFATLAAVSLLAAVLFRPLPPGVGPGRYARDLAGWRKSE
jgi:hypothetical protein